MWAFVLAILIALAVGGASIAFLEGPPPATGVTERQPPQQQTEGTKTEATTNQRGTHDLPLFVQVLPSPKTEEEAAQDKEDHFQKSLTDRGMLAFTGISTVIFLAQLFVFGRQARQLKETVETMKTIDQGQLVKVAESIAEAARAAKAMEDMALEMGNTAKAVLASAQLAQKEFASAHRPRLFIRSIHTRVFQADDKIIVRFTVFNRGDIEALGVICRVGTIILRKGKSVYEMEGVEAVDCPFGSLRGGMEHTDHFQSLKNLSAADFSLVARGESILYFCGIIAYDDNGGNRRKAGFSRRYDPETHQFIPTGDYDADYEY